MASKAEQVIDHFTKDAGLKAKILKEIDAAKKTGKSLEAIIAEFTTDAGITAKIKEIAGKVSAGHKIHAITGYHHSDVNKANSAAENVLKHHGAVEHIMKTDA